MVYVTMPWLRIRPRCAISLGKSIVVAYSNSQSPREYEFATDRFMRLGCNGFEASVGLLHLRAMVQDDPAGIVEDIGMHACNYGQREYSSKLRKIASGCWA